MAISPANRLIGVEKDDTDVLINGLASSVDITELFDNRLANTQIPRNAPNSEEYEIRPGLSAAVTRLARF